MVTVCKQAVKELAKQGIKAELIDLRTIKPLDIATVANSVRKTHHCVLVEEGHIFTGISSEVAFQVQEYCFDDLDAPPERVTNLFVPMPYNERQEHAVLPDAEKTIAAIKQVLYK